MNYARRWNRRAASTKARRKAIKDQIRRGLLAERLEDRTLMAADVVIHPFWNVQQPSDVNNDGFVAASDALAVINTLNGEGSHQLGASEGESGPRMFIDVNNDGYVSPADALAVINQLNAEGEDPLLVKYILQPINAAGTSISTVQTGSDFYLQLLGQDLRPDLFNRPDNNSDGDPDENLRGVYAAYMDILYQNNLAAPAVSEVQSIVVPVGGSGSFTLTYGGFTSASNVNFAGGTTASINFDQTSATTRTNSAANIATALNNFFNTAFGAGAVTVTAANATTYRVTYTKILNTNIPEPTTNNGGVTVAQFVSTNPADASYSTAFTSAITYTSNYGNGKSGGEGGLDAADNTKRIIDDVGAFWSAPTDAVFNFDPLEVLRIHMFALQQEGTAIFTPRFGTTDATTNPAPNGLIRPSHDTLVFGNLDANPVEKSCVGDDALAEQTDPACKFTNGEQITFMAGSIQITSGPINPQPDTLSFNEDDPSAANRTVNVLANDSKNAGAPAGALQVDSFTQPASGGTVSRQNASDLTNGNLIFTPNANFNGTTTFTYIASIAGDSNPNDKTQPVTVTVTIAPVNDKPVVAAPASVNMQENTPQTFTGGNAISVTDVDFNDAGSTNTGVLDLTVSQGTLTVPGGIGGVSGNNTSHVTVTSNFADVQSALSGLVYTAADAPNASVSLQVSFNDNGNVGSGGPQSDSKSVTINITAQNDAPVNNLNGTAIVNGNSIVAIPNQTFVFAAHGSTFSVTDADAAGSSLTTTLTLSGSNPLGTLHVDTTSGVTITGNDSASVQLQGSQTAITSALATLAFTPPNGSVAAETLTIVTNDGGNTGAGGPLTTTNNLSLVLDPGVRPFPLDDQFQFNEGTTAVQSLDVLGNDFKDPQATTTIVAVGTPVNTNGNGSFPAGSVVIHAGGTSLDYTPPADTNFFTPSTPITFTYTIHDTVAGSTDRTATASIRFTNVPDAPVAVNDGPYGASFVPGAPSQSPTVINAADGVLKNDTDVDNSFGVTNYATLTSIIVTPPTKGNLTLNADGSFSYTPTSFNAGNPNDTFTYKVHAVTPENAPGGIDGNTATVTIHVTAPPVATNDHFNVLEQGNPATSGNVLTGAGSNPASGPDTDGEGLTLTAVNLVQISDPSKGSVTLNADGTFTYNPPTGQNFNTTRPSAPDITFTYQAKASDGRLSNVATVSLTVQEVNDPPTAVIDDGADHMGIIVVKKNAAGTIGVNQPISVLVNDSVAPDDASASATSPGTESLTVVGISATNGSFGTSEVTLASGGKVRLVGGQIFYDSPLSTGTDSFFYQISDNSAASRGGPLTASAEVKLKIVEFVPKTVSGTVYLDTGNGLTIINNTDPTAGNGVLDAGEKVLSGVTIHLTGTDFSGQPVSLTTTTDINGHYTFPTSGIGLAPPLQGTSYTITEDQPLFLLDGLDSDVSTNTDTTTNQHLVTNSSFTDNLFLIKWSVTDTSGNVNGLNFGEGGIDVRSQAQGGSLLDASLLKQEYLASSGQNGFIFELDTLGNMLWSWTIDPTGTAWSGTTGISAQISGYDPITGHPNLLDFTWDGQTVTLGLGYNVPGSTARFRVIGIGPNGQYLIRVDGSAFGSSASQPFDGMFAANAASGAGGEGEAAPVDPAYAGAADAVFTEKSWA